MCTYLWTDVGLGSAQAKQIKDYLGHGVFQPLAGYELDELHKGVEGHVLGHHTTLTAGEQRLHDETETTGNKGGGEEGREN